MIYLEMFQKVIAFVRRGAAWGGAAFEAHRTPSVAFVRPLQNASVLRKEFASKFFHLPQFLRFAQEGGLGVALCRTDGAQIQCRGDS